MSGARRHSSDRKRSRETLADLVHGFTRRGERAAVGIRGDFGARWHSYRELASQAAGWATRFAEAGVATGDRVIVWAANGPEWAAVFFGAMMRGVVVVPLHPSSSPEFASKVAHLTEPKAIVHDGYSDAKVLAPCELSIYGPVDPPASDVISEVAPEAPAVILYTSGTTREPRGVVLTHANVMSQVAAFRWLRPISSSLRIRILCLSPLSHSQGLVVGLVVPMALGAGVLFSDELDPIHVIRTVRHNRIHVLLAVPRVHDLLIRALRNMPYRRSKRTIDDRVTDASFPIRRHRLFLGVHNVLGYQFWVLLVGGAPLSAAAARFWFDCGLVLVHGYGLTETAALISVRANNPLSPHNPSVGRPLPNQEVVLDESGQVLVRGDNVSPGLWDQGRIVSIESVPHDGFLPTGDLASLSGRRQLHLLGRRDELIVMPDGSNVHAQDIEEALRRLPEVKDAVAIPGPDSHKTEVHAVLLLHEGASADQSVRRANQRLEAFQRIRSWTVWPEADFPRSPLGKVKRPEVTAALQSAATSGPDVKPSSAPPTLESIRKIADKATRMDLLAEVLTGSTSPADGNRFTLSSDFGLGSLDIVELLTLVERTGSISSSEITVEEGDSVATVSRRIASSAAGDVVFNDPPRMDSLLFRLGQRLAPAVLALWSRSIARLEVTGETHLARTSPPFIVACAHHEHGADAVLLSRALPSRLRRRLLLVTSHWLFQEYSDERSTTSAMRRLTVGLAFEVGMPMLFPYVLWPSHGVSRSGLLETGRLMDHGYNLVVFPEADTADGIAPGIALMALQTGASVIPTRIAGNKGLTLRPRSRRPRIDIEFLEPISAIPDMSEEDLTSALASALAIPGAEGSESSAATDESSPLETSEPPSSSRRR